MTEQFNQLSSTATPNILLKVRDVAKILNISRSAAYYLVQTGQLPSVRVGRSVRVRPIDLEAFVQGNLISPVDSTRWKALL